MYTLDTIEDSWKDQTPLHILGKEKTIVFLLVKGYSIVKACQAVDIPRSTFYFQKKKAKAIIEYAKMLQRLEAEEEQRKQQTQAKQARASLQQQPAPPRRQYDWKSGYKRLETLQEDVHNQAMQHHHQQTTQQQTSPSFSSYTTDPYADSREEEPRLIVAPQPTAEEAFRSMMNAPAPRQSCFSLAPSISSFL